MVDKVSIKSIDSNDHELIANDQIIDLVTGAREGVLSTCGNENARFLMKIFKMFLEGLNHYSVGLGKDFE